MSSRASTASYTKNRQGEASVELVPLAVFVTDVVLKGP